MSVGEVEILLVEDNPEDVEQFRETVRQLGMYWLLVNQAPPREAFGARRANPAGS